MNITALFTSITTQWLALVPVLLGLLLTVAQLRHLKNAQKVANQLEITKQHRDVRSQMFNDSRLGRVLDHDIDLKAKPITNEESLFVTFLILHLKTTFRAQEFGMIIAAEALRDDMRWFFSLPIRAAVWKRSLQFQDERFAKFVEDALKGDGSAKADLD